MYRPFKYKDKVFIIGSNAERNTITRYGNVLKQPNDLFSFSTGFDSNVHRSDR